MSRRSLASLADAIGYVTDKFEERRRQRLSEALAKAQEDRAKHQQDFMENYYGALAEKARREPTPHTPNLTQLGDLLEERAKFQPGTPEYEIYSKKIALETERAPTHETVPLEDQRLAESLGISLESYLKRAGKIDKPVGSPDAERPTLAERSAGPRFLALPEPQRKEGEDRLTRILAGRPEGYTPTALDTLAAIPEDGSAGAAKIPPGVKKIMEAGKAAGLIQPGQQIDLTDEGLWTAQWLEATEGGYSATTNRVRANNNLSSVDKIRKLFKVVQD